ncbi:hypothetical protein TUMSATVNIG3_37240 [Vibrio nigripulchritudo]|nr:hypothetical protein TUMSATVNIG2_36750 [Vibrio nigripulchritudo]BDU44926.1 hypothetical protein TUMSATVNIG3_37240 [Vibrio nigripulchritudo]
MGLSSTASGPAKTPTTIPMSIPIKIFFQSEIPFSGDETSILFNLSIVDSNSVNSGAMPVT